MPTPKTHRIVYKRVNGQLLEPTELLVYSPLLFGQMYAIIGRTRVDVHIDPATSHLYYEDSVANQKG